VRPLVYDRAVSAVGSLLESIEWESCALEPLPDAELLAYLRRELGMVPRTAIYMTPCPWIVRSLAGLNQYNALLAHLEIPLAELIALTVSEDNSCRYCFGMQRFVLRMQGVPEPRIRALADSLFAAELDPRSRSALEFARRFSRANPLLAAADAEPLRRAGWSEPAIREIAFVAAAHVYYNRVATLPALPPQPMENLPDRWWMRVFAGAIGRRIRRSQRPGAPESLPPDARAGPFEALVASLDGLPAARALRGILDEAFASAVLPRRTKGLIFAVVAHALGCPRSEAEAARLLAADGLGAPERDEILAHLASPRLDATEAALLPLARDTIHYRPAQIQRRARALRDTIGVEPFVEFVGVASLANAVCRLASLTAEMS